MSVDIHPTALVAKGAELADGVSVGPYCIIGEHVKIEYCELQNSIIGDHAVVRKTMGTVNVGERAQINA